MNTSNERQYQIGKPSVTYNPLLDGRDALMASTRTLKSHVSKPSDSAQYRNHIQQIQNLPQIGYTPTVNAAAQGNSNGPKNRGFQYRNEMINPSNAVSGLRSNEISLEGQMRTSSWDNETKMSSFAFGDRSLNDIGLNEIGKDYSFGKASSLNARDLLGTRFATERKPVSGELDMAMARERNWLDPIYMNKRRIAPTNIVMGIDTRQTDFEPRNIRY